MFRYKRRGEVFVPPVTGKLFVQCRWIDALGKKRKGGMLIEPPLNERKEYVYEALRQITGGIVPIPGSVKVIPYLEAK